MPSIFPRWIALSAVLAIAAVDAPPLAAFPDTPAPRINCSLKKNRNHPSCKQHRPDHEEFYNAAYVLAKSGRYAEALTFLAKADQDDPRVLNYTGFVTRKMGDVAGAMVFYRKALALDPSHTTARAYMGEAMLQQGDVGGAKRELAEIAARCGTACAEHADLAGHIAAHEAKIGG